MPISERMLGEWLKDQGENHRGKWLVLDETRAQVHVVSSHATERETKAYATSDSVILYMPKHKEAAQQLIARREREHAARLEQEKAELQAAEDKLAAEQAATLIRAAEDDKRKVAAAENARKSEGEKLPDTTSLRAHENEQVREEAKSEKLADVAADVAGTAPRGRRSDK